jgi:phage terminase large subunit
MRIDANSTTLPVHVPFHKSRAPERMLFGAMGSGKSYAVIDEAIAWCLEQPGIRGLITRKTVPELRDTTERVFEERMPFWDDAAVRRTGGHLESYTFPNGSVVLFRSIDDWKKHKSLNLGFICYDETNEFDEETYLGMLTRVRQRDLTAEARSRGYRGEITRRGVWGAANPEGRDWLWERFHPASPKHVKTTEMFTSTTLDNPYLPPEYIEQVLQMPTPWVRRYVLCEFDDFAGRIYDEWGYETHVVPHPTFAENMRPLCRMGMDPGTENPTAALWVWLDEGNRRLVGIAEYQQAGVAVDVHARHWRRIEAEQHMQVQWRVADPNAIGVRDRGTMISLQTQYSKQGFHFAMGASSDKIRIPALAHLIHTRRFVVSERCMQTFEAIKDYQWKDLSPAARAIGEDPKEQPLKKDDHLVNCAQFLAGREAPMPKIKVPQQLHPDPLTDEVHRAIRKQLVTKYKRGRSRYHDLGGTAV